MSQEDVEAVREVYEAFNDRDWDGAFRHAHPDFEITTLREPTAGTRRGRERIMEFAEDLFAAFDTFIWEPEEFFDGDDLVVAYVKVRSRPKGGSFEMEARNGHLWTIREGSILSLQPFPDPEDALEAAGLSNP
jgi:ketosteroid isomerase-like protein